MSGFDWNKQNESYRGIPPEVNGEEAPVPQFPPEYYKQIEAQQRAQAARPQQATTQESYQQLETLIETEEDEEYYNNLVANDARLRLVQGSLYEKIMNHNLFEGYDADPRAIKNVEREIRKFARERLEIMLGMRQEKPAQIATNQQFTEQEVAIVKALISRATTGSSASPELNKVASSSNKLNTISSGPAQQLASVAQPKPKAQAAQPKPAPQVQSTAPAPEPEPEGPVKLLEEMTDQEREAYYERNRQKYAKNKAAATGGIPMPTKEAVAMGYQMQAMTMGKNLNPGQQDLLSMIIKQP